MLYAYNLRGEQEVSALDVNRDGVIDYDGTDRVSRTVAEVATRSSYTVQRTTTQVWETDGQDTATTVAISEQGVDGLRSWQTIRGLTTGTVVTLGGSGSRTVTTTAPDGTVAIQTYANDRLSSSLSQRASLGVLPRSAMSTMYTAG